MNKKLAAEHSIDTHTIRHLQEALINEKKRRKRGKKLDLCGEETHVGAVFWSPMKIQRARDFEEVKEADKAQEILNIAERKRVREAKTARNKEEKAKRSAAYQERLANSRARKAKEAEEAEERRQARQLEKDAREAAKAVSQLKESKKALENANVPETEPVAIVAPPEVEEVVQVTSRGRRVAPHRFRID